MAARDIFDSSWIYFVLAGLLVLGGIYSQVEISIPPRSVGSIEDIERLADREDLNLVLIVIDTLRADRLSSYGYERATSPIMDSIAASGVRFDKVESQSSWTKASMASLWTSMYPERTGVHDFSHALPEEATLPAEILKDAGFQTSGIFRNGWVMPNFGFSQGFDLYIRPLPIDRKSRVQRPNPSMRSVKGSDLDATDSAIEFIRANLDQRFFVYVHYMDVHQYLYDDDSTLFGTDISDIYDNSIHWVDRNVGVLLKGIEDLGLAEKTIIAIASDHGEAFMEHGVEGHARNLYREVQDVPLILYLPFRLDPGITVESAVANVDIWPTLLDLLGLPPMPSAEGHSLVPLIVAAGRGDESQAAELVDRPVFSQVNSAWGSGDRDPRQLISVVRGPYRFVHLRGSEVSQLFDHQVDPGERVSIAKERPDLVEDFMTEVDEFLARENDTWEQALEVEISEMRLNQLRALGYSMPELKNPKKKRMTGVD
ncbi:MAG: sulfatase [Myxococcota bacterium]